MSNKVSYFIHKENRDILYYISILFSASYFLLPQYFGFQVAGFDMTINRLWLVISFVLILSSLKRSHRFFELIFTEKLFIPVAIYLIVLGYTMVLRTDISSFMNGFIEFLFLFVLYYLIKERLGVDKFIHIIRLCFVIICLEGFYEYLTTVNLFMYLQTIPAAIGKAFRSGHVRVMGPCGHALGYGLLLELVTPLCVYDCEKKKIDVIKYSYILFLLLANIFFTGSRSNLGFFGAEVIILLFFTNKEDSKRVALFILTALVLITLYVILFFNTGPAQYIMLQVTSVLDTVFKTDLASKFGAESNRLQMSEDYRKVLPKIFFLDALNPLIGRGASRSFSFIVDGTVIVSIDNFYVATYIKYAYPGLFSFVAYIIMTIKMAINNLRKTHSPLIKALLLALVTYYFNLWYLDTLQTLRYAYALVAILLVASENEESDNIETEKNTFKSKYIINQGKYS